MEQALSGFVRDVQQIYGGDLVAVFLYGSAAAGEHVQGRSDINVAIVLSQLTPGLLCKASNSLRPWARRGLATPVFFDTDFLQHAVDVFPIELFDMQLRHRVLWGPDVTGELHIERGSLRRQCERELRSHLLKLRQAYVESSRSPRDLEAVLMSAASGMVVLARALLHLKGADSSGGSGDVLDGVETQFGIRAGHLRKAWQLKRGEVRVAGSELASLYQAVLEELQQLVLVIDALPV